MIGLGVTTTPVMGPLEGGGPEPRTVPEGLRIDELVQSLRLLALLLCLDAAALCIEPQRRDTILDIFPVGGADAVRIEPRRFLLADQGLGLRLAFLQAPRTEDTHARRVARGSGDRLSQELTASPNPAVADRMDIGVAAWAHSTPAAP